MNYCVDCKHYMVANHSMNYHGQIQTITVCGRVSEINPVNGLPYITQKLEAHCWKQREKVNAEYPRCGYEGKWFEDKEE